MMLLEPGGDEGVMEPILQVFRDLGGGVPFLLLINHCYIHFKNQDSVLFFKNCFHLFLNSLFTLFFVMRVSHISYHIHTDNDGFNIPPYCPISWVRLGETAKQHSLRAPKLYLNRQGGKNHSFLCFFSLFT